MNTLNSNQESQSHDIAKYEDHPRLGLTSKDFREAAFDLIDRVIEYQKSIGKRQAYPDIEPGFLRPLVPETAPEYPEEWSSVFADIEQVLMKGMTQWLSPSFFAYFPVGFSYPGMLGELLSASLACVGFTWASCPSCTELETAMMDWLARALNLPECFVHDGKGPGGGVIQGTASEATLVALLAARSKTIRAHLTSHPESSMHDVVSRMVAYTSSCSHSSVEKAGKIALVEMRQLKVDENASMRGDVLLKAITEDRKNGKIPFYVCATIGTTSCCSYDNLLEIGKICDERNIWLHVDAAYAGSALLCPEFRHIADGIEYSTSFNYNPHKWMMVNFDCSAMWVRNSDDLVNSLNVDPLYLQHDAQDSTIDYRHWQIPLGRRFRSIKLWFVLRMIGLEGLRNNIRRGVAYAKHFEKLVQEDSRFEVVFPVTLGLVCIRLFRSDANLEVNNKLNQKLYEKIQEDRRVHLTPSSTNGKYYIRVCTSSTNCDVKEVEKCWEVIKEIAGKPQ